MINWESNQTQLALKEIQSAVQMYGRGSRVVRLAYCYRRLRNLVYYGVQQQLQNCFCHPHLDSSKLHILLHLRGGLGDCASYRVCILALREKLPNAVFHYYTDSPHAAEVLFEADEKNVLLPSGKIPYRRAYDMACELCISFKTVYVNHARIQQLAPDFLPVLTLSLSRQKKLSFFLQDNYLLDDALGRFLYRQGADKLEAQRYLSALDFDGTQTGSLPDSILKKDVSGYGLKKPYITLHSGINATFNMKGSTPLKCWPKENWSTFVKLFREKFPHIQIVQLGGKNSPKFDFVDVCLVGKSGLQDLPALLAGSTLHIDGESGLVQLTRWLPTRAVVLFANTAASLFALPKNINLTSDKCGACMWLKGPSWHTRCMLGYSSCQNMQTYTPEYVLEIVSRHLAA